MWWFVVVLMALASDKDCGWGGRSSVLVAPDGKHAAYGEWKGVPGKPDEACCEVDSSLVVRRSKSWTKVADEVPGSGSRYRFEPVDWSKDSRHLLLHASEFICAGDQGDLKILVWDSRRSRLIVPQLDAIRERHRSRTCVIELRGVGFTGDGKLVVESSAGSNVDVTCPASEAVGSERWWSYDLVTGRIGAMPRSSTITTYATRTLSK